VILWYVGRAGSNPAVSITQRLHAVTLRNVIKAKRITKGSDIVLDLFGGSGTTLIACESNGRHARLMEYDPKYVDVIIKRWEELTGESVIQLN
ncbi:TPA: DNA methyltransferase, partial [Streptococcus pyogenes]